MIKPVFNNIQNAIQAELFKATKSIKIAVAWFTNDLLYQILLLKLQTGVSVELILNDDDINRNSDHHLDFDLFVNAGGKIYWANDKNLMHQKFCIIDENVVINGSYNWTYKAEYNNENVNIISGEETVCFQYINEFSTLIRTICKVNTNFSINDSAKPLILENQLYPTEIITSYTESEENSAEMDDKGVLYSRDNKKVIRHSHIYYKKSQR